MTRFYPLTTYMVYPQSGTLGDSGASPTRHHSLLLPIAGKTEADTAPVGRVVVVSVCGTDVLSRIVPIPAASHAARPRGGTRWIGLRPT